MKWKARNLRELVHIIFGDTDHLLSSRCDDVPCGADMRLPTPGELDVRGSLIALKGQYQAQVVSGEIARLLKA